MASGIYAIVAPSGNCYIGSAKNIAKRWREHRRDLRNGTHHNTPLANAFAKYGTMLCFTVIETCEPDELLSREQFHIDARDFTTLYNVCPQAGSATGHRHSEQSIAKMRAVMTPERRANISLRQLGSRHRPDSIARMREVQSRRSVEWREKLSASQQGKFIPEDVREKMSKARNTSGFKGVTFFKRTGKWIANARLDGKQIHLGYFDTAELADAYRLYFLATQGVR